MARRERVASGRRAFAQLVRPQPKDFDAAASQLAQSQTAQSQTAQSPATQSPVTQSQDSQAMLPFESLADAGELWIALQLVAAQHAADASNAALAQLALAFTSRVSLEPDAVLLEVRGSRRLFGGLVPLRDALLARVRERGFEVRWALAPTPRAALALARAGRAVMVSRARLVGALETLPLAVLRWDERTLARLEAVGVRDIGAALRLPRAGFTQRFGRAALADLDRLVGRQCEPRRTFVPRERFRAQHDPGFELLHHEALLRAIAPMLAALEDFLRTRQCGIEVLVLRLVHRARAVADGAPHTQLVLRLAAADFLATRFAPLLAEHLARVVLPAPVVRCELRSGALRPLVTASDGLWRPGEHGGLLTRESPALVERLRARLGAESVYGLDVVAEHRPEIAWCVAEPALRAATPRERSVCVRRPLWLLRVPEPLARGLGGLQLLDGPERIESGWWDGRDVARDYYIARDDAGAELWVYRERLAPHAWYLHGRFG